MKNIISCQNSEIKKVYALRLAKERKKQNLFVAEGLRACITLIESKAKLNTLYVTEKNIAIISPYANEKKLCLVSPHVMQKISQAATPSGILGVFEMPPERNYSFLKNGLVITHVSDPGNMGTLIRTAAAMNVDSVVIVEGADPWSFKTVQSSAGFITHVDIFQCPWSELIKHAEKNNINLAALVVANGKSPESISKKNTLLIVGSEAHGIPQTWLSDCTTKITLSMPGKIESLNAAIAGSIAMYILFAQ